MKASIVIPVFGPQHYLNACLDALAANSEMRSDWDYELVLVDNGTGYVDDAVYCAAIDVPTRVIRNDVNLGFAKACNLGAEAAVGDALVFLNVDTEPQQDWLDRLIGSFRYGIGIVGSKLVYPDGRIQHSGITIHHDPTYGENRLDDHPSGSVDGTTGACLAIVRDTFFELGGFDEDYWNGNEDVDLCLKAASKNVGIWYCAESVVMHHESATGPERWERCAENVQRLANKWSTKKSLPESPIDRAERRALTVHRGQATV